MTLDACATPRKRLACVLAVFCATYANAAPLSVSVSADRQTATVGDPIVVTVSVEHHRDWQQIPQPIARTWGEFDVLKDTSYVTRWGEGDHRLKFNRQLTLAIFRTGGYWVPAFAGQTVADGDTVAWQSDSLAIVIESVLDRPEADTTDIAGLKGPYVAPEPKWYWWVSGALALMALSLYLYYRHRKRAALPVFQAPPPPPWEVALKELASLRHETRPDVDGGRIWYFRLSDILRRYWDGRYGWQTIDQTTTEIVRQLPSAPFSPEHRRRAEEFLRLADRVRYAKQPATEGRPEIDWEWVHTFVRDTIPPRITSEQPAIKQEQTTI